MTDEEWLADGWEAAKYNEFINLIGPIWHRRFNGAYEFALTAQPKHGNMNGGVHGGLLMAFADNILGTAARLATDTRFIATVQINCQMLDAGKVGERLFSRPRIDRGTKMLVFVSADIFSDDRLVVSAMGVFKKLKAA